MTNTAGAVRDADVAADGSLQRLRREESCPKYVVMLVGLGAVGHLVRDRRFWLNVIVLGVGLAAAAGVVRKSGAGGFARLVAWDRKQAQRAHNTKPR